MSAELGGININWAIAISAATALLSLLFFPIKTEEEEEEKPIDPKAFLQYQPYEPPATWSSDWKVLQAMWFSSITGEDLQERLNNFYESQADLYDST